MEAIGITLKGKSTWSEDGKLETYYLTPEEQTKIKEGNLAVIGNTLRNSNGTKNHDYIIVATNQIKKIDIFYDIEDDYKAIQTVHLKNGRKILNITREDEYTKWVKQNPEIEITKSYGC